MDQIGLHHLQGDRVNSNLRLLLHLVRAQADVSYLLNQGIVYSQVSALFGEAIKQGLLKYSEGTFQVTELGQIALRKGTTKNVMGHQSKWISTDDRYVIPQIGIDDVFLPKKRDTYFS